MTRIRVWTLAQWNARQCQTWHRCVRRYGWPYTPEMVNRFATRYAERHQHERATIARAA